MTQQAETQSATRTAHRVPSGRRRRFTPLRPSLGLPSLGLPFPAANGWASGGVIRYSTGPSPATSTHQVRPPLLFPSCCANRSMPDRKSKLSVFGSESDPATICMLPWTAMAYTGSAPGERPRTRPHGLTQQKRQEIKEAFDLFDTDNSGTDNFLWGFPIPLFPLFA